MDRASRFAAGDSPNHIAQALLRSNLSISGLRALSPLSDRAQILVDQTVVNVGMERLVVTADLLARGLTYPLSDPLSVTQIEWEVVEQTGGAQRTMSPSARGENQLPKRDVRRLPVYLTTDDFSIGIRTLKMSQRVGQPLDTTLVEQATRRVNEAIEDSVINGVDFNVAGYSTPGLLSAPGANTHSLTDWTLSGTTGETIRGEIMAMIEKAQGDKKYGPYVLYVGTAISNKLTADFKANGNDSILSRLQEIQAGGANLEIKSADLMPVKTAVLVQMTSDVIQIVDGQRPTVIPWTSVDGFTLHWMVMAIMIPRVRADYNDASGIVIGTWT